MNLLTGDGVSQQESPYGRGGVAVSQPDFEIFWIHKEQEAIESRLITMDVDDVIVVLQGGLKLELHGDDRKDEVLGPGDLFVIPAGVPFKGYRFPRDQMEPTIFIAIYRKQEVVQA